VPYELVGPARLPPLPADRFLAEPDLDAAAHAMRTVAPDPRARPSWRTARARIADGFWSTRNTCQSACTS
jgi:hypothetical protein